MLRRQRQRDLWVSLGSQCSLLGETQERGKHCLKNGGWSVPEEWHLRLSSSLHVQIVYLITHRNTEKPSQLSNQGTFYSRLNNASQAIKKSSTEKNLIFVLDTAWCTVVGSSMLVINFFLKKKQQWVQFPKSCRLGIGNVLGLQGVVEVKMRPWRLAWFSELMY